MNAPYPKMKHLVFAGCLLLASCIKTQQPTPNYITPDKETVRKLRELADEAAYAEQPKAAQLTTILLKARIQLWAIGNASNEEKTMIFAAEASRVLGPCAGERNDECDAAFAAQLEKDLKVIAKGKESESVKELQPLLDALTKLTQRNPEGLTALRALSEEDSWRGAAARLFALSRLTETWEAAAEGSTISALATLRTLAPLVCAGGTLQECAPKTSPWAQEGAEAFAFGAAAIVLLQRLYSDNSDFGKTAQTYSLPAIEQRLRAIIPLPPAAMQSQLKTPTAERWTNAALAFPQSVKSRELPRLYVSLQGGVLRLGLPPALQIVDKKLVLLDEALSLAFPGGELKRGALQESLQAQLQALQEALTQRSPALKEQLEGLQAMVIIAAEDTPIEDLSLLYSALSALKISSMSLLVCPKKAPTKEELVFGAALPLSFHGTTQETLWVRSDGTAQATLGGAPQEFANASAVLAQAALFAKAPQFIADPKTTIGQVVGLYDGLRVATRSAWGTLEQAPLSLKLR